MVTRIGLVVALACIAVPATLMGSTWYFIRQNPALDTASAGDTAIWCQDIMEISSDSTPVTPDSFTAITANGLDSLGLQGPSAQLQNAPSGFYAVDSEYSTNRIWKSWLIWQTYWYKSKKEIYLTGASGTYRPNSWGYVAVFDSIYWAYRPEAYNAWQHTYGTYIIVNSSFLYPWGAGAWWRVWGTHSWGSDWQHTYKDAVPTPP